MSNLEGFRDIPLQVRGLTEKSFYGERANKDER